MSAQTKSFLKKVRAMPKKDRLAFLAALERKGTLAKALAGSDYILQDGTVATFRLAKDMGLLEP